MRLLTLRRIYVDNLQMEALKQEAETNFTFSPEINPTSRAVTADAGPVFERLATSTSKEYMQEVLMKVKTELELKECTFHPKLSTEGYKFVPKEGYVRRVSQSLVGTTV